MRVRVLVDVQKSLMKKLNLKKQEGEAKDVVLKYERFDDFCYIYGVSVYVGGGLSLGLKFAMVV